VNVLGFGSLELWVGNARQAAAFFSKTFGFSIVAHAGPETGTSDRSSYVLQQGGITLVLTGATTPDSAVATYVREHGDGVRDIALVADDVQACYRRAMGAGARPGLISASSEGGPPEPVIGAFGDLVHTLVESVDALTSLPEAYEDVEVDGTGSPPIGLVAVDHYAISVEGGCRESWVRYYQEALGFERMPRDELVDVDGSAFTMSTIRVPGGDAALVLAEPASSLRKSQIADYLEHFGGPGVHHVAFSTRDIERTVATLRQRGIKMLEVPASYYDAGNGRVGDINVDWRELAHLGVVIDADEDGYLLQAFTEPLGDRPTTYLEIIQREGTRGFGTRNVRDLYSAVVREQGGHGPSARAEHDIV
jgi:4-hydroxyphenylpyruvate dioxygenase